MNNMKNAFPFAIVEVAVIGLLIYFCFFSSGWVSEIEPVNINQTILGIAFQDEGVKDLVAGKEIYGIGIIPEGTINRCNYRNGTEYCESWTYGLISIDYRGRSVEFDGKTYTRINRIPFWVDVENNRIAHPNFPHPMRYPYFIDEENNTCSWRLTPHLQDAFARASLRGGNVSTVPPSSLPPYVEVKPNK